MKSLCVYCGSSFGIKPVYADAARALAREMVGQDITLVYGGGNVGLMGVIANEVLRLGGEATGVIPQALLDKEVGHSQLTHLHVVRDMHERKAMMAQLSDGFIAMPGGIGTLEELFEVLTWSQLGFHEKPIGVLNVDGFYDGLISFVHNLVTQGFLKPNQATLMMHETSPAGLLHRLQTFIPQPGTKVLDALAAKTLLP
ncbi:TIGR00730 family Rossman fold protein [Herminiimonas sp.]|uniref:LOG family protein n=1 Tax=Herminiimonas sp. TaxID=1926289 RepID=UPI0027213C53|nr:TIGR00730 family Rossman fold protein [Herminiimonas sp.]MDO8306149.1 TIGR00730 family Rossman fold protein [Herminiimonas sp.]